MEKQINTDELKKIQLDVLKSIAEFCKTNKLRYFLAYGTLLGCIRHNGYIPWDDDIDIVMPRKDYQMLLNNFNSNNNIYKVKKYQTYCKAYDFRTDLKEDVNARFDIGVNIDIFPLDGLPDNDFQINKFLTKTGFLYKIYTIKILAFRKERKWYKNLITFFLKLLFLPFPKHIIIEKINNLACKYDYDESKKIAMCVAPYGVNEQMDKIIFEKSIEMPFEGINYLVPQGFHEYLTNIYGNYMQLPPEEKQVSHHAFKAYWK